MFVDIFDDVDMARVYLAQLKDGRFLFGLQHIIKQTVGSRDMRGAHFGGVPCHDDVDGVLGEHFAIVFWLHHKKVVFQDLDLTCVLQILTQNVIVVIAIRNVFAELKIIEVTRIFLELGSAFAEQVHPDENFMKDGTVFDV